jgi:hypothetical protein
MSYLFLKYFDRKILRCDKCLMKYAQASLKIHAQEYPGIHIQRPLSLPI